MNIDYGVGIGVTFMILFIIIEVFNFKNVIKDIEVGYYMFLSAFCSIFWIISIPVLILFIFIDFIVKIFFRKELK